MKQHPSLANRIFMTVALVLVIINGFFPAVWLFLTSFKREGELTRTPITYLPADPTLNNYVQVFERNPFELFLRNSLVVSIGATLLCVLFAALAGYALGRLKLRGRRVIMTGIVMTSMFPALVLLVPLYRLFRGVELPFLNGFLFLPDVVMTPNLPQHLLGAHHPLRGALAADCNFNVDKLFSANPERVGGRRHRGRLHARRGALPGDYAPQRPRHRHGGHYRVCELVERVFAGADL